MRRAGAVGVCMLLGACSTVIEGRHQQIVVNTNPSGANCGLYRQGVRIATAQNTPSTALIEKTKHDIWVVCVKQGYQQATYFNRSGTAGATVGNIILGGGIGWAIDSATGADNKYDSPVNISLVPVQLGQAEGPAALPSTFAGVGPQFATVATTSAQGGVAAVSSNAPVVAAAKSSLSDGSTPAQVASVAQTPTGSQSAFDGQWMIEMTLSSVTRVCPDSSASSVLFANRSTAGPWGSLRFTSDGDLSGWMHVSGAGAGQNVINLTGRLDGALVVGKITGRCIGTFRMTRS